MYEVIIIICDPRAVKFLQKNGKKIISNYIEGSVMHETVAKEITLSLFHIKYLEKKICKQMYYD